MTQEALNIAGQCRATASSELAKNILVDEGNGLLTELLLDAARIIEALAQTQEPFAYVNVEKRRLEFASPYVKWDTPKTIKLDKIPLYTTPPKQEQEPVSNDPLPRACNLAGVDYQTFLKIKAYMPITPPQENT